MIVLLILLLLWICGSVIAALIFWGLGVAAFLQLRRVQKSLKQQKPSSRPHHMPTRLILQDRAHPLYPATRRLMAANKGFFWSWLSGLLAALTLSVTIYLRQH